MRKGQRFTAYHDWIGEIEYTFEGIDYEIECGYDKMIRRDSDGFLIYVDDEWFEKREIALIG